MTKDQIRAALDALDRLEGALILSCDDIMEIHYENDAETIRAVLQSALDAQDDIKVGDIVTDSDGGKRVISMIYTAGE